MPERIAPFAITTDERELDDLRLRLRRTRWAETETSDDWSQGVPLAYLRDLCGYWADEYDWGPTRDRLNRIPQFTTRIDGLDIHFAHVRSRDPDAVPLILTHGWPGSFFEYERVLALLSDEFHLIVPSL